MDRQQGGLADRLRDATRSLHRRAEHTTLQTTLAMGILPRDLYIAFLGQMIRVHRALETQLDVVRTAHPAFELLCQPHQRRADDLLADLSFFNVDPATIKPLPATKELVCFIDHGARNEPLALLGCLYVTEGSLNGSKHAARSMRRTLGIAGDEGVRALDPYGDQQMQRWLQFRADLDAIALAPDEEEKVCRGAQCMFEGVIAIGDQICPPPEQLDPP